MSWYQIVNLVVDWIKEILDVVVRWPMAIIICLLVFREPINSLIRRTKGIQGGGIGLNFGALQQSKTPEDAQKSESEGQAKRKNEIDELMRFVPKLILEQEEAIKKDLINRDLEVEGKTVDVLIRILAGTQMLADFWSIYNFIFGSQIVLLKSLNQNRDTGMKKVSFESWFSDYIKIEGMAPIKDWNVDGYLRFLFSQKLVVESNDNLLISQKGISFLEWLTGSGLSENRPF